MTKIEITHEDIRTSTPRHGCHCPVYKAAVRNMPEFDIQCVWTDRMTMFRNSDTAPRKLVEIMLPESAKEFIYKFDDETRVAPFCFDLDLKTGVLQIEDQF